MKHYGLENPTRRQRRNDGRCTECNEPHVDGRKGRCDKCLIKERDNKRVRDEEKVNAEIIIDGAMDYVDACQKHPRIMRRRRLKELGEPPK
jgi:hypothetical protein